MKSIARPLAGFVLFAALGGLVWAHCEIPCGIYGDRTRIDLLYEHTQTIEKSMRSVASLAGNEEPGQVNQLVRWVANKEEHADKIQELVTQYFMTQRVKPVTDEAGRERYLAQLTALHAMLISAMKCKQSVDVKHVTDLRAQIDRFSAAYFSEEDLKHIREHHGKK